MEIRYEEIITKMKPSQNIDVLNFEFLFKEMQYMNNSLLKPGPKLLTFDILVEDPISSEKILSRESKSYDDIQ
jgi:hypothetical protein